MNKKSKRWYIEYINEDLSYSSRLKNVIYMEIILETPRLYTAEEKSQLAYLIVKEILNGKFRLFSNAPGKSKKILFISSELFK